MLSQPSIPTSTPSDWRVVIDVLSFMAIIYTAAITMRKQRTWTEISNEKENRPSAILHSQHLIFYLPDYRFVCRLCRWNWWRQNLNNMSFAVRDSLLAYQKVKHENENTHFIFKLKHRGATKRAQTGNGTQYSQCPHSVLYHCDQTIASHNIFFIFVTGQNSIAVWGHGFTS